MSSAIESRGDQDLHERKQPSRRLTLVIVHHNLDVAVPIIKYTLLVGSSLLALLLGAEHVLNPAPIAVTPTASNSLEILRKMANHGEVRGFAPLADAGAFHLMPVVTMPVAAAHVPATQPVVAAANTIDTAPVTPAKVAQQTLLDAQARVVETQTIDKPLRRAKKVAVRKPKQPRTQYVENMPRGPFGFFGGIQSW